MNTNPQSKRILCYGDSNTWGYMPGEGTRFPANVRWTGILQELLGTEYEIIEEGLNSRTTNLDDDEKPGKNGLTYLIPCLQTHSPLNKIILFLGTNDLKEKFNRSPEEISDAIRILIKTIFTTLKDFDSSNLILVSPTLVNENTGKAKDQYRNAGEKSKKLGAFYEKVAKEFECKYLDLSKIVESSDKDGYHLDESCHSVVANAIYKLI